MASGEGVPRARTKYTPSVVTMALSRSSLSRRTDSDNTNLKKREKLLSTKLRSTKKDLSS